MKKETLEEIVGLILGCIFMGVGINMFLGPHTIAPGGLSGLSVLLNKVTGLSVSMVMFIISVPLVIFSFKILGLHNFIKTMIGTILLTICIELTSFLGDVNATNDLLLASIAGGILLGTGIGVVIRVDGSTGGTDLIGLLLNKMFKNIKTTQFIMMLDGIIVIASGVVNQSLEIALYSAIALSVMIKVADIIIEGFDYSKAFLIISDKSEDLRKTITQDLDRGMTIMDGRGGYTETRKDILLVVVSRNQEVPLKKLVKSIDPKAFIVVSKVHEVLGEGFKELEY